MSDTPTYPNARDCEHGHQRGKCVHCELNEARDELAKKDAEIAKLESKVGAVLANSKKFAVEYLEVQATLNARFKAAEAALSRIRAVIEPLREMEGRATKGPWLAFYKHKYDEWHVSIPVEGCSMKLGLFPDGMPSDNPEADCKIIAEWRNAFPAIVDALKADALGEGK